MWGPCGPRKTLKAAQTLVIEISKLMFYMIVCNTEHTIPVSFWGPCGPRIFKNAGFFLYSYEG